MPNPELFLEQDKSYQESILPKKIRKRVAVEAAQARYWYEFVGLDGAILGLSDFGLSAPAEIVQKSLHVTCDDIIKVCLELLTPENSIVTI